MLLEFGFISTPFLFDILGITTLLTLLSQRAYESSTGKSIPFWKRLWQLIQMLIVTCIGLCGLSDVFQIIAFLWISHAPSLIHSPFNFIFNIKEEGTFKDLILTFIISMSALNLSFVLTKFLAGSPILLIARLKRWSPAIIASATVGFIYGTPLKNLIYIPSKNVTKKFFINLKSAKQALKAHFLQIFSMLLFATILLTLATDVVTAGLIATCAHYLCSSSLYFLATNVVYYIIQPFAEELIYRNFLVRYFQQCGLLATDYTLSLEALLPIALLGGWLFALPHFLARSMSNSLIPYIELMLAGAVYSLVTLFSGSIGSSSMLHSYWNFSLSLLPRHANFGLYYYVTNSSHFLKSEYIALVDTCIQLSQCLKCDKTETSLAFNA